MDVSSAQAQVAAAKIEAERERGREIAEQERLQQQDIRRQEELAEASRSPEQAAGQIVNEAV
ncbi:hypothetical protein [Desulfonatronum sp. SC1]|uniref:hypothetical protein n=1 Tax=Desulfonatronum sp. SC1 TaxID=2109626 RepID=UPI000D3059AB|nr:hypothetical protein [Desulfonatronum sp. SC1]PTN38746.1 hypothetical protein C6366_02090 [Desulfonatronum sp. SC1]